MDEKLIAMVDDEPDMIEMVSLNLNGRGFRIKGFNSDKELFEFLEKDKPDLIMLDLMLRSGKNGFEICKHLRKQEKFASIPIIMFTSKDWETDKVSGLDMGADDYIVKPCSMDELKARIRAVLRRYGAGQEKKELNIADMITIDQQKHEVKVNGEKVELTPVEFKILEFLCLRKNQVFSRDRILEHLWGEEKIVVGRTIDVHIRHLREKLGKAGKLIKNVRGFGYKLEEEV